MTLTRRMVAAVSLMGAAVVGAPALATAGSPRQSTPPPAMDGTARLYELTENMKLALRGKPHLPATNRRLATSALTGVASPGSPLCPKPEFQSGDLGCAINVQGMDDISLVNGLGTFGGAFATVVHGDNPVDGPEMVVLRGEFRGQMDFEPAIRRQIPYGTVVGRVKATGGGRGTEFTGVFRLPFDGNVVTEVAPGVTMKLREIFCPSTPENPLTGPGLPFGPFDLKYLDTTLDSTTGKQEPNGQCINIRQDELSLGTPLVRFDIEF